MSETESVRGQCAICRVDADLKCSGCKRIFYCGLDHQKIDWNAHKNECLPYKIDKCERLGRFMVATRDILAKECIFIEPPLVFGPKWCLEHKSTSIFPCIGCFSPVSIGIFMCTKCNWPCCSNECKGLKDPLGHGLECDILRIGKKFSNNFNESNLQDYYRSDALLTLRCILLYSKYPQKWRKLMELESHDDERQGTRYYEEAESRIVSYLKNEYLDKLKINDKQHTILPSCESKDLHRICGIMEVNALNIELSTGLEITALYAKACLLQHSCIPNCFYTFNLDSQFKITMRAGRDINKGEPLSIMYTHMLWGTQLRHEHLMTNKYFTCECERCTDPTELGTYLSALQCLGIDDESICEGSLLPVNPISSNTDWLCNKCPVRIANEQVDLLLSNIEAEVDLIMMKSVTNAIELEQMIEKLRKFLHKNHYHIFSLNHSLIQLYGREPGYTSDHYRNRKIEICKNLLRIVDIIDPDSIRLSLYTGIILYELQDVIVQQFEFHQNNIAVTAAHLKQYEDQLDNAFRYLERAKLVLENDKDNPKGNQFMDYVNKAYVKLNKIMLDKSHI